MSHTCCSEGDLRTWLDGELDVAAAEQVAAHLAQCPACEAMRQELAARAMRVADLMADLALPASVPMPRRQPERSRSTWRWVVPVAALAAAVILAVMVFPNRRAVPKNSAVQVAASAHPNPAPSLTQPPAVSVSHPMLKSRGRRVVAHASTQSSKPVVQEGFQALDDEPFETGVIMRVGSPSGDIQADVIVGPDGRARAYRIVKMTAGT